MAVTLDRFLRHLIDSELMTADEVDQFRVQLPAEKFGSASADEFARGLVRRKILTPYQASALFQEKPQALVLGNYAVLEKIGEGGMGTVFKAKHRRMGRVVALKVISQAVTKDSNSRKRFQREVIAAAKLNHPNIVAALDADEHAGTLSLVMDFVDGPDLSSLVKSSGPLPVLQAVDCIFQAAHALEYAHQQGVVHRDIKPHNLLMDQNGTVKILDMGLARLDNSLSDSDGSSAASLTQSGAIMGTVDYMSPEQALDTKHADARSDIYSLGCTLFYLVTGKVCYQADTMMKKLLAHRDAPIPSLRAICPDVPPGLEAVFRRMVAKQPEDRYPSMTEVISALSTCLTETAPIEQPVLAAPAVVDEGDLMSFLRGIASETVPAQAAHKPATKERSDTKISRPQSETLTAVASTGSVVTEKDRRKRQLLISGGVVAIALCLALATILWKRPRQSNDAQSRPETLSSTTSAKNEDSAAGNSSANKSKKPDVSGSGPPVDPLPKGVPAELLPGLLWPPPSPIAGLGRWQVETMLPRSNVVSVALSPDQNRVACGESAGLVRLYDTETWRLVHVLAGHTGEVVALAWSPDGTRLASGSNDKTVRLWHADGTPGPVLKSLRAAVVNLSWSHNSRLLAGCGLKEVSIWNSSGGHAALLRGHAKNVRCMAWSPDGKRIVSGSDDQTLRLWKSNGALIREIKGHQKGILSVSWGRAGWIASCSADGTVCLWPADGGNARVFSFRASHLTWAPDGEHLVVVDSKNKTISMWGLDGPPGVQQANAAQSIESVALSGDGQRLAWVAGLELGMKELHGSVRSLKLMETGWSGNVAWSPDGTRLVASLRDKSMRLWRADGKSEVIAVSEFGGSLGQVAWSPDAQQLATADLGTSLRIWTPELAQQFSFQPDKSKLNCFAWSPDGKRLVTATHDDVVRVWQTDGTLGLEFKAHEKRVQTVSWNRDGQIASAGAEGKIHLWRADGTTGPVLDPGGPVSVVAWSPDGQWLLSGRSDGDLRLFRSDGTAGPIVKQRQLNRIDGLAWSPESQQFAAAGRGSTSGLESFRVDAERIRTFEGCSAEVNSVSWSSNGKIAAGDLARTVRLWDAVTGRPLEVIVPLEGVNSITIRPDGQLVNIRGDADQSAVYLVERDGGRIDVLTPSEFAKLAGFLKVVEAPMQTPPAANTVDEK